ncbi:MAG: GH25 family lysozyme [Bacillota bacterium]|nr:GH25 family lysozyme [Bacillota bacterium]
MSLSRRQRRAKRKRKLAAISQKNRRSRSSGRAVWRRPDRKSLIKLLVLVVLVVVAFFAVRNLYFFMTESGVDEDNPYPVKGVDVSNYQKVIDWEGLESEGIRFAFIKATEGSSHVDKRFEYNWDEAHKTGMKVGAYHFMSYDTSGEGQAANYIETVDKKWGMLPPVVDVEFYGEYTENHPTKKRMYRVLNVMLEELEDEYGKKPLIYTNGYIYENYISGKYDDYPIWISDHDIPKKLSDGREWTFCQYTFTERSQYVAGGEKNLDMNVFNGSEWEFRKYDGK